MWPTEPVSPDPADCPDGTVYASEFEENEQDEVNLILPGQDYGWPSSEENRGAIGTPPIFIFPTADASTSGIACAAGSLWMASLRGQRLLQMPNANGERAGDAIGHFVREYGCLRTVEVAPDGALWVVSSETDGFGWAGATPTDGDDRILRVEIAAP